MKRVTISNKNNNFTDDFKFIFVAKLTREYHKKSNALFDKEKMNLISFLEL